MVKSIKYLEFFEALLDPQATSDARVLAQVKGTDLPALLSEAFSLDEQLNRLQAIADEKVLPELEEAIMDSELLELARTVN